ncbi:hypothetical protein Tco_0273941 [Tanacetum coccineum]
MHTRSQTRNLHNQQHQAPPVVEPFNLEEPLENPPPPVVTMDDQRTMAQLLEAPTAGYEDAIVVPEITADNFELKHGLLNLVQNKQFFGHGTKERSSGPHPLCCKQDSLHTMKFTNVQNMVKALLLDKKNQSPAPTPVKAVEESCVTCGGAHSYQTCPATTGNVYRDNIQEYVSQAAAANYNQGNTGNNQNRYNQNRGNFNQAPAYQPPVQQGQVYRPQVVQPPAYQAPAYQAPAPQTQGVSKTDFDSYVKANDAVMRNMHSRFNMPNQLNTWATSNQVMKCMLGNFIKMNTASTSGTLPSNTVTNPKEDLKGITTRSGVAYKGPTIHTTSSPKVVER